MIKRGTRVCPIRVIMKDSVQWEVKDLSVPAPVAGKVNDVKVRKVNRKVASVWVIRFNRAHC